MRKYEIMYILNSNLDETTRKSTIESLNKIAMGGDKWKLD